MSACDCLENLRKVLEKHHGPVELQTETVIDLNTGKFKRAIVPPLVFTYRKNGKGRKLKAHVAANFCQFCGAPEGGGS